MSWGTGLTIIVVGGALWSRPYIVRTGKRLGLRMIAALDREMNDADLDLSGWDRVVYWSAAKTREDYARAAGEIAAALGGEKIDGVVCFSDYCVPLTAMLAEHFAVARCASERLWACKSKLGMYSILQAAGSPYPPRVRVLDEGADLAACAREVGLPAVLRISHSNSAIGTRLVSTLDELKVELERMRAVPDSPAYPTINPYKNEILLVEYLVGSEHDVDVVIVDGEPRFWFVTDNGPTDLPYFRETSHLFPSRHPAPVQDAMLTAATSCLRGLGLPNGVYNVELRLTKSGPRLIEINLRMGGFYIREFAQWVWGYDLCEAAMAIACGRPPPPAPQSGRGYLAGFMCYPSDTLALAAIPPDARNIDCGSGQPAEYEEPIRMLSFPGATPAEAVQYAIAQAPRIVGPQRGETLQRYLRTFLND